MNFQFDQPVKIIYGEGSINSLGELANELKVSKALIVCDPFINESGMADMAVEALRSAGKEAVIFHENAANPAISASEKAYELFKKESCDLIVGLGGGSNIDCAKGVHILRYNPAPLIQYANLARPFNIGSGLILIPTTSGTGSELSDGAILSDEDHVKHNFIGTKAFADYAILDPELLKGMPPKLTAFTGLDAFTHACEGYTGNQTSSFNQFLSEKAMDTIVEYLPRAIADGSDMEARGKMAVASCIGGFLLCKTHTHAGHSIGQVVGGAFNIPHGIACAYAEPWVLEFNADACPELTKRVAVSLGAEFSGNESVEEIGAMARDAFIAFRDEKCNAPDIYSYGFDESRLPELASAIEKDTFQLFNPKKMTSDDALKILKKMYHL